MLIYSGNEQHITCSKIVTHTVYKLVKEAFGERWHNEVKKFFCLLCKLKYMNASTGYILEDHLHIEIPILKVWLYVPILLKELRKGFKNVI
jgi:hypothetical protein